MMATTHALGGATAALLVAGALPAGAAPAWLAAGAGALGGLLPDVDHPGSFLGKRVPLVSDAVHALFGHRGATHGLLAAAAFSLASWWAAARLLAALPPGVAGGAAPWGVALCFLAGYLSHLLLDMLNPQPVPLLWPLPRRFRLPVPPVVVTGDALEAWLVRPLLLLTVLWLGWSHAADVVGAVPSPGDGRGLSGAVGEGAGHFATDLRRALAGLLRAAARAIEGS